MNGLPMRFFGLNLLRHWHHSHHAQHNPFTHGGARHHHAHGLGRHGGRPHLDDDGAPLNLLAARLDLDAEQRELFSHAAGLLQQQRRSLISALRGDDLKALFASENFDRAAAQFQLDALLDQLRAAGPALIAAIADGFDSLDFDQQQALRFLLRGRRARSC
jgi:hypothetical protein